MSLDQNIFNIIVSIAGFTGGWCMKLLYDQIKGLQYDARRYADKVASMEVLIAGQYVTLTQFNSFIDGVNRKLDNISDKIDRKADKAC